LVLQPDHSIGLLEKQAITLPICHPPWALPLAMLQAQVWELLDLHSSSSKCVHRFSATVSQTTGQTEAAKSSHLPTSIIREQMQEGLEYTSRIRAMLISQLANRHTTALLEDFNDSRRSPSPDRIDMQDILSGETSLDLSHAGGEFADSVGPPVHR
jgi:hypothetical protein